MESLRLKSGIVMSTALLFTILALATPGWIMIGSVSIGLFGASPMGGNTGGRGSSYSGYMGGQGFPYGDDGFSQLEFFCAAGQSTSGNSDAENVTIAFLVLAMVTLLPASILVIFAARVEGKDKMAKIGGALAVVSALFLLIAMASYTGLKKMLAGYWGYSYAIGWAAFCLTLPAGPVAIFAK